MNPFTKGQVSIFGGVDIDIFFGDKKVRKQEFAPGATQIYKPIDQVAFSDQIDPGLIWQASEDSGDGFNSNMNLKNNIQHKKWKYFTRLIISYRIFDIKEGVGKGKLKI